MTKLEQALAVAIAAGLSEAAKAFKTAYMGTELTDGREGRDQPKKDQPTPTSNGIAVCNKHGKNHVYNQKLKSWYCHPCWLEGRDQKKRY